MNTAFVAKWALIGVLVGVPQASPVGMWAGPTEALCTRRLRELNRLISPHPDLNIVLTCRPIEKLQDFPDLQWL